MGQKTNPIANRLGIIRGWDSNWFGGKNFESKLVEDDKIRKYLNARLEGVSAQYLRKVVGKLLSYAGFDSGQPGRPTDRAQSANCDGG